MILLDQKVNTYHQGAKATLTPPVSLHQKQGHREGMCLLVCHQDTGGFLPGTTVIPELRAEGRRLKVHPGIYPIPATGWTSAGMLENLFMMMTTITHICTHTHLEIGFLNRLQTYHSTTEPSQLTFLFSLFCM